MSPEPLATRLVQRSVAGTGCQRGVGRRPELRGPSDAHRARVAPPPGSRRRRRSCPERRLACRGAWGSACAEERAWLGPPRSTPSRQPSSPSRGCGWKTRRQRASMVGGSSRSRSRRRWRPRSLLRLALSVPAALTALWVAFDSRARRQARLLRAGRRAVRGRPEQLLQRRRAVLRARAGEDARRRRHRNLRLLPRARPRDCGATSAHRGPGRRGRGRLGGDPVPVAKTSSSAR